MSHRRKVQAAAAAPQDFDALQPSNRSLPYVAIAGFVAHLTCGVVSSLFPDESFGQILSWQIGTGCAITANVVMGVWLARKGADLAAAGFTMLGIVDTVFFSGLVVNTIEYRIAATGNLLLVPALILVTFCRLFPRWVKVGGWLVGALFLVSYARVARGTHRPGEAMQVASFLGQEVLGVIWSVYIWREARRER